jgi:hypothetical protein
MTVSSQKSDTLIVRHQRRAKIDRRNQPTAFA